MSLHTPHGRPLRVAVLGNSIGLLSATDDVERPTFVQELGDELACLLRRDVTVDNHCRYFGFTTDGLVDAEHALLQERPDVVVLCYGLNEARPRSVPRWVTSQAFSLHHPENLMRHLRLPLRRRWHRLMAFARRADGRAASAGLMSPSRFERELLRLVEMARWAGSTVLLVDPPPTSAWLRHNHAGYERRCRALAAAMDAVAATEPSVRRVSLQPVEQQLGDEMYARDPYHFTPRAHRAIGHLLAETVAAVCTQPVSAS
jgi:lysophospholipase L1-like esterase